MPITVTCEQCGKTLRVKDELAGRRGKCPGCKAVLVVPAADAPAPAEAGGEVAEASTALRTDADEFPADIQLAPRAMVTEGRSGAAQLRMPPERRAPTTGGPGALRAGGEFAKIRKAFGKLGYTVVILGLISLLFLGDASHELFGATLAAIGLCAVTGVWLAIRPSVGIGVAAGGSLVVLGVMDLLLALGAGGLALFAPTFLDKPYLYDRYKLLVFYDVFHDSNSPFSILYNSSSFSVVSLPNLPSADIASDIALHFAFLFSVSICSLLIESVMYCIVTPLSKHD